MKTWGKNYIFDLQTLIKAPLHPGLEESTRIILSNITLPPDPNICDIGCGTAISIRLLTEKIHCRCIGIDLSKDVLRRVNHIFPSLINADAEVLPLKDETFDFVLIESVLLHCSMERVFLEMKRIVKKAGWLAINDSFLHPGKRDEALIFLERMSEKTKLPFLLPMTFNGALNFLQSINLRIYFTTTTPSIKPNNMMDRFFTKFVNLKYGINESHTLNKYVENKIIIGKRE